MGDEGSAPGPRRVRRGEGELADWPRGLLGYTPTGPDGSTPSDEEDRLANRLRLAARLLGVLRSEGQSVEGPLAVLRDAQSALDRGDRPRAAALVNRVMAELERSPEGRPERGPATV